MSQQNVELVERIHARWNARESTEGLVDEDFEYVNPPEAIETGTVHGRGALAKILEVLPDFQFEIERVVDLGDDVLVVGNVHGTSPSGIAVRDRQSYIWTIADGRAVRFKWFRDPALALREAGLEE